MSIPAGPLREYCSLSSFNALGLTDKTERALGRIFVWSDTDTDMTAGHVFMSYTAQLEGPIDPTTQG